MYVYVKTYFNADFLKKMSTIWLWITNTNNANILLKTSKEFDLEINVDMMKYMNLTLNQIYQQSYSIIVFGREPVGKGVAFMNVL